jgi:hypothetical protein
MATSLPDESETTKPKFLDQVRTILRTCHYSLPTEEAYLELSRREGGHMATRYRVFS